MQHKTLFAHRPIRRGRRTLGAAAAALALMALAACSAPAASSSGGDSGEIILGRSMDVSTLDPERSLCDSCQIYNGAVYDTLLAATTADGDLQPLLAQKWEANDDNTEFTFHLDPDAVFSDGSPVEAKDVKWSFERLANLKGDPSYFMAGVKEVAAPDAATVVVTTDAPNSAFFNVVTAGYTGIINSDVAIENGATADKDAAKTDKAEQWFLKNSAGAGQYVLTSYEEGSQLVLSENKNYWGDDKPNFKKVVIKDVPDASTQLQQLQQGDIDVAMQLSFDTLDQVKSDESLTSEVVPTYNYVYLGISPGAADAPKALDDKRVREALRKAIDYDTVIDATVAGQGSKQASAIPNGFEGSDGLDVPTYDPEGAKALLAEAGASNLKLEATYPTFTIYGVNFSTMFQSIQQSMKKAGIELTLNPLDYTAWGTKFGAGELPLTAVYFAPDHPDAVQYFQYFSLAKGASWLGYSGLSENTRETKGVAKALTETGDARAATYSELGQDMIDDAIILPVVNPQVILAGGSNVSGNNYHVTRNIDLRQLKFTD
ncbi:ABC transporter substrate-binding protein [Kineosporia mesophila]|uniref:ABC transporter substrate-binding protein n=1 Tax=Kineosporia mesophila TaxID=566012 RepID=A0ABP6Z8D3_9ACTN|nr:ABC transporter substrate-binding protein [Kineosporia mesophila]MCD5352654.1 ABC transporter substrate-binding protein [Kineosporia mesophila]